MDKKICSKCLLTKELSCFCKKNTSYNSYCKECNRKYQKQHYENNKRDYILKSKNRKINIKEFINNIKINSKCLKCNENDIACLDFHHINDNTKDFNIAKAMLHSYSLEKIQSEINKCIILCSNCHRKLHYYQLSSSNRSG